MSDRDITLISIFITIAIWMIYMVAVVITFII